MSASAPTQETKPFYRTSEFWGHSAFQILLWVGALPTAGSPHWIKTVISGASLAAYSLSRGIAKSGVPFVSKVLGLSSSTEAGLTELVSDVEEFAAPPAEGDGPPESAATPDVIAAPGGSNPISPVVSVGGAQ